jgi:TetR/AcrR family transcriptional regulator, mexJK operon transcriptional repressor
VAKTSAQTATSTTGFTPRRGRPSAAQLAAISETILTAAQALFLSEGYANTTMEAVAASAGVGKATLYARYATKQDLFQAIFAARIEAWQAAGADAVHHEEADITAWLRHRALSMLHALRDPEIRAFDHLMVSEASRFPELARAFHEMGHMLNARQVAERLARANGEDTPSERTLMVAKLFASGLIGWFRQESALGQADDDTCEAAADAMAQLLVSGRTAWR